MMWMKSSLPNTVSSFRSLLIFLSKVRISLSCVEVRKVESKLIKELKVNQEYV